MERPPVSKFSDLIVWQKAHEFALDVYKLTADFPRQEMYGLTLQIRRAAVSIPANIAEGFGRQSKPEKARFMNIAQGSLEESRYFLMLARDLKYCDSEPRMAALDEVGRLLRAYRRAILNSCF